MAYRSLSSAHPLAFSYPGGASSSDGPAVLLEQSPARSKAPSDGPSEFSSWHDDASSSLAPSGTARDGTITVNPLVMRMGEHLKGKQQGLIRQRFENYLQITRTLQNDIGKLAALTCELRLADHHGSAALADRESSSMRVSISCNEDGTFVVYTVPDAAGVLGSQCSTPASSESQASVEEHQENDHENASVLPTGDDSKTEGDLQSQWVHKVCEFGMSGRCHSLTALFHFGYTTWKQLMHGTQSAWGMESVEDVSPGHIAEEEQIQEVPKEEGLLPEAEQSKGPGVKTGNAAESKTLLTKLHELRSSKTHAITESIKKKVENQLAAPSSPCLSTATHDSGLNSHESTRSLTPREGTPETSPSESATTATPGSRQHKETTWRTDKEIGGEKAHKERELQPWEEPGGNSTGTLEELSSQGEWDQFKANAELFGYVSTFKDDLSQYSTTIDPQKLPATQRKKAERVAREIELRQCCRGSADEEPLDSVDEEDLFSAVQRDKNNEKDPNHGLHAVSGSFFHVDGVGLVDENVVRSHPWMLNSSQPASAAPATGAPFLSTQPQNPGTAGTAGTNAGGPVGNGMVLSTNPVPGGAPVPPPMQMPPIAPGMPVILDGLTNAPHFNGISAVVESFDVETNRYNVQLPIMDISGACQVAKIRPENLRIDYRPFGNCQ